MQLKLPVPARLKRFFHKLRFEWIGREPSYTVSLAAGHEARRRGDWRDAAIHFAQASRVRPDSTGVRLQLGHALKETGRVKEAEAAYRSAVRSSPKAPDPYVHLGHSLKIQGRRTEAAEAYAKAIAVAPRHEAARSELIALGARSSLSSDLYGGRPTLRAIQHLGEIVDDLREAVTLLSQASTFPAEAWAAFRAAYPLASPPPMQAVGEPVLVVVDARQATPWMLRTTLISLTDQSVRDWCALIICDDMLAGHSVASLGQTDPRIRFVDAEEIADPTSGGASDVLLTSAGVRLEHFALAWFRFAAGGAGVRAVYGDHDHHKSHWRTGPQWFFPALFAAPGRYDIATSPATPAAVLLTRSDLRDVRALLSEGGGAGIRKRALLRRLEAGEVVVHLPQLLSSIGLASENAYVEDEPVAVASEWAPAIDERRILAVVPTRDQAKLLEACVASMRATASRPELLDILVLDNRSEEAATLALLQRLSAGGEIEVQDVDQPFNWARFNNIGVEGRDQEIFLFANNDLEMLSVGWDDEVRRLTRDQRVGVVGARLLYEDRTLQHAGIVLGAVAGRPIHEGRGVPQTEGGPLERWLRIREAAAVTGAFLAVRAEVFKAVGGFDEALAIGYNDVDFCLRVRGLGLDVLYASTIEGIHYESKTRGHTHTADKVAWDDAEFESFYGRWGDAALEDGYVSPVWTFAELRSFDGLRTPMLSRILRSLESFAPTVSLGDGKA